MQDRLLLDRLRVRIIVRVAKRLIDDLNVPAGCKWLLDAIVVQGWLVDDSREWCRVATDQRKAEPGETEHMEVTIIYEEA